MSLDAEVNPAERARAALLIDETLRSLHAEPWVQQVEYDDTLARWYFRFGCEGRDAATIYFDLDERTLRYELYFLPAFEGDQSALHRWLLQKNQTLSPIHFSMAAAGDVYLRGRWPLAHLDESAVEHIIGAMYQATEALFQPALSLAKAGAATAEKRTAT
ncbi:MAG: hypothetical protein WBD02_09320 [Acidimicrobiia bacterium]